MSTTPEEPQGEQPPEAVQLPADPEQVEEIAEEEGISEEEAEEIADEVDQVEEAPAEPPAPPTVEESPPVEAVPPPGIDAAATVEAIVAKANKNVERMRAKGRSEENISKTFSAEIVQLSEMAPSSEEVLGYITQRANERWATMRGGDIAKKHSLVGQVVNGKFIVAS